MNIQELQQVESDLKNGVLICRHTLERVIAHAIKTQQELEAHTVWGVKVSEAPYYVRTGVNA